MQSPKKTLTHKNRIFVNSLLSGKTQTQAYLDAYDTKGHKPTVYAEASRTARLPQVRHAMNEALAAQNLTPEFAIGQLKKVAEQDDNYGTKRQALIDLLRLMGVKI